VVARALAVASGVLLVIGPALQARAELREAKELTEALGESQLSKVLGEAFALYMRTALIPLGFLWPPTVKRLIELYKDYLKALEQFAKAAAGNTERAVRVRAGVRKAINWLIVLTGAVLLLSAAIIVLATGNP
jgi:hypothetical protein